MKKRFSLFLTVFGLLFVRTAGQPVCDIRSYSATDGLAQNIVTAMLQDHKGFLWIGTWDGINKFDGYTFRSYKPSSQHEYAQSSNRVTFATETVDGNILCQTYDGKAYLFDTRTETFLNVLRRFENEVRKEITVQHIYPLRDGIVWIVCDDGYCFRMDERRYDKPEGLTVYNTFDGQLKGNRIFNIYQDTEGDEWILTDKGITIVGQKRINNNFPFKNINEIDGKVYLVSTSDKPAMYQPQTGNVRFIDMPRPAGKVSSLVALRNTPALLTDNGIMLYQPATDTFEAIDVRSPGQPSNHALSVYEDKEGDWWVFTSGRGVTRLNPDTDERQWLYTPQEEVMDYGRQSRRFILEDPQGTLWVLPTQGNLSYYDRERKRLSAFHTEANGRRTPFTPLIRYTLTDRQGNVWLAGARGIQKMNFAPRQLRLHRLDERGTEVRAFLTDDTGCLWVASKNGVVRLFRPDGTPRGYLTADGRVAREWTKFGANIYSFAQDPTTGRVWMGSKDNGLFRLSPRGADRFDVERFRHDTANPYSLSADDVYAIRIDSRGDTWIGCYGGGLNLLREASDGGTRFIHYGNELKSYPSANHLNVRTLAEVGDSVLLAGTTNGVITFDNRFGQPEEIVFHANRFNEADTANMVGRDVMHILADREGDTYALTFTGGINRLISTRLLNDSLRFRNYTVRDGLASDLTLSMTEDGRGRLWVACEDALSRFDPASGTFDNYGESFLRDEFSFTEAIPVFNARGRLVLGTNAGFLEVDTDTLRKSAYTPPIVFTELRIHGTMSTEPIDDLEELRLIPSQRNVTLRFAALDYVRPESILYAYRLEGLESQWNSGDNSRSASYINLPPGRYTLEVRSTNSDGVWTDNIRRLPIHVLPTFWETAWAWLVYVPAFLLLVGVLVYILFYIYRLRHEMDVEHQLSDMKLRFFTDISHELRTPLTLITSPVSDILDHEPLSPTARNQLTLVHKNTERMLRLINQILDFRKIQNRKMKLLVEYTELTDFVRKVTDSFKGMAAEKGIDYRFDIPATGEVYAWVDRDKMEKILFNLLSNAFKYTLPGKSIKVNLQADTDKVAISVSDEGIGIAPDKLQSLFKRFETFANNMMQPSSGIGLSLVKELVELHHGNIDVSSQPGRGSTFRVTLPLDKRALEGDDHIEFLLSDTMDSAETFVATMETDEAETTEVDPTTGSEKPTLLIVEDNTDLKTLLKSILAARYHTIEASNGQEGLDITIEMMPDLILTDVMMPVMDGIEMIRHIKADKEVCHIPIIVLSAKSSLDDRITGLEQGIDDYVTKPFSSAYLKAKIASLFERKRQMQERIMNTLPGGTATRPAGSPNPIEPDIIPYDEQFIGQVMEYMEEQMDNPDLAIDDFASRLSMSRSLFYRKLKSITGLAPIDFVREIRFKRAIQLMEGDYNISQIAYMTGFNDPKYFSKSFKKYMGIGVKEYREGKTNR
ncbi:MAG: response regulator [Mediterranea sp.]|jgi:signal transduction histidine kinase/DNA-binding response OmpR family regulator/ligand-binding sensor domain-containing protein|nr:response regulator [Mediterranea sp.]